MWSGLLHDILSLPAGLRVKSFGLGDGPVADERVVLMRAGKAALRGVGVLTLIGLFAGCALAAGPEPLPRQSWNGYKWARNAALAIRVGTNVSSDWMPYITRAAAAWSTNPAMEYVLTEGSAGGGAAVCKPVYGTVQMCNADYGPTGWVGYTQVWTNDKYIVQATIRLNEYYFAQAKYNSDAYRKLVTCQEMGNALGLEDADRDFTNANSGSCTDYTNDPSGKLGTNGRLANLSPSKGDLRNLAAIYRVRDKTQLAQTMRAVTTGNAVTAMGGGEAAPVAPARQKLSDRR